MNILLLQLRGLKTDALVVRLLFRFRNRPLACKLTYVWNEVTSHLDTTSFRLPLKEHLMYVAAAQELLLPSLLWKGVLPTSITVHQFPWL